MGEYHQIKGQLTALERNAGGSLAVRDLGGILKPGDLVDTENLATLFVVASAHAKGEWLSAYETLSDFVARGPRGLPLSAPSSCVLFIRCSLTPAGLCRYACVNMHACVLLL